MSPVRKDPPLKWTKDCPSCNRPNLGYGLRPAKCAYCGMRL